MKDFELLKPIPKEQQIEAMMRQMPPENWKEHIGFSVYNHGFDFEKLKKNTLIIFHSSRVKGNHEPRTGRKQKPK